MFHFYFYTYMIALFRKCRIKRRNARRNKNINILNTEFKRTAKINNLEVAQVLTYTYYSSCLPF